MSQQELITADEMPPEIVAAPAVRETVTSIDAIVSQASALVIASTEDYRTGSEAVQRLMGGIKRLEAERKSLTDPMNLAKERVMGWFRGPIGRLEAVQSDLRKKLIAWDAEQKRIQEEARRKAEAEERERKAAQEREAAELRRKAQEEQDRLAREAQERQAAEDRARREAEEARKAGDETAAKAAEDQARKERMERIRAENQRERELEESRERAAALEAEAAKPVVLPPVQAPVKVSGQARRQVWRYKITDPAKIKDEFWMLNEPLIASTVRTTKDKAQSIVGDGIQVWAEDDLSIRAK